MEGEAAINYLTQVLGNILSPDNTQRNQAEQQFNSALSQDPNSLFLSLLQIIQGPPSTSKTLASMIVKKLVAPGSKYEVLALITPEVTEQVKTTLLNSVQNEQDRKVWENLCEATGLLGSNVLMNNEKGSWESLLPFLYSGLSSEGIQRLASLEILATLFPYLQDEFVNNIQQLHSAFENSLGSEDVYTRLTCIKAITSFLSVIDTQSALKLSSLVPLMLTSVDYVLQRDEYKCKRFLEYLSEVSESEPKVFKGHYNSVVELVTHIFSKPESDLSVKNLVLEFAVSVTERMTKRVHENTQLGEVLMQKTIEMMVSISPEVDESWERPEEGFQEKSEEEEGFELDYAKVGRKLLTRLLDSVGDNYLVEPLLKLIYPCLNNTQDWRYPYAALMTLSEINQYISESSKIAEQVSIMEQGIASAHPKIRYATFHLIGQVCEDHIRDFQSAHKDRVVPLLQKGLNDSVPRVAGYACAALTNFMEGTDQGTAAQCTEVFFPKILEFLSTPQPSILIEHSCTALASIAHACKQNFREKYSTVMPYLGSIVQKYTGDTYKTLRGRVVECMTLIGKAVGKEIFGAHAPEIIRLMKALHDSDLKSGDSLVGYLLTGWQTVCEILGDDFAPYLDEVAQSLLQLAATQVEISTSAQPQAFMDIQSALSDEKKKSVSTTETENKELALQTLLTVVDTMKGKYSKYVEDTIKVTLPLVNFSVNEDVRGAAASLLGGLVEVRKDSGDLNGCIELSKNFIKELWGAVEEEFVTEAQVDQLQAIKTIIATPGGQFLSQEEVSDVGEKTIKALEKSIENRQKVEEDSDDEEDEEFEKFVKSEEDNLHTALSEVLGALFKTHKDLCVPIVNFLFSNVFPRFLDSQASPEDHKFAIFIIDDIIEFLGQGIAGDKWNALFEALAKHAAEPNDAVRQAACYGLGIFACYSAPQTIKEQSTQMLSILEKAIAVPQGKKAKTHGHARDNAIAALGRLIKHQGENINLEVVVPVWVRLLPLTWDKAEAKFVHDLLTDICNSQPQLVLGPNNENLYQLLKVFGVTLESKLIYESTTQKVQQFLTQLKAQNPPGLTEAWNALQEAERNKLLKVFS